MIIDKSGGNIPTVPIGNIQIPATFLAAAFFGFFILLAVLNSLRNRNKYKNPDWIEDIFTNGVEKEGIYVDYDAGGSTESHYIQAFFDKDFDRYEVFTRVPFKIYTSLKPLTCKALIYNDKALITKIIEEKTEYRTSNEFVLDVRNSEND